MHVNQEDFDQQLENVMKPLLQHMEDEEKRLLPQLVRNCWERELVELGEKFDGIKNKLPTHPHPSAPNRPPMEKVVAFMTAPLDRAFDAMAREFPEQTGR